MRNGVCLRSLALYFQHRVRGKPISIFKTVGKFFLPGYEFILGRAPGNPFLPLAAGCGTVAFYVESRKESLLPFSLLSLISAGANSAVFSSYSFLAC